MDSNEATTVVLSRIKSIDPENATKIMGYLLIQDLDEKDLIRLAFGPETLLHSYILKAKAILSRSSTHFPGPSTPPSPSPFTASVARSNPGSHHFMPPLSSPRLVQRSDFDMGKSPKSSFSTFQGNPMSPSSGPSLPFGGSHRFQGGDYTEERQMNDFFPFLSDAVSNAEEHHLHRRSHSDGDAFFASEDGELCGVNRPCHYFARGFCKNGTGCKFLHGGGTADDNEGSASTVSSAEQMLRLKFAQHHQRVASAAASQLMLGTSPSSYDKFMASLLQHQNDPQRMASMMMADDMYKYGRFQQERSDLLAISMAEKANSSARQIYLTFPADSTFKDEDVSEYFSTFGPVQDVRIPYQQKRMFGFVTFHFPETVRLILAKGNPHFICNSRVLVKPYKEKGKLLEKRQMHQQFFERGEFPPSASSSFPESRDLVDNHALFYTEGPRNSNMLMLRRKLEQEADLQQAIEFQGRRLMNLQLPDLKNDSAYHHHMQQRMSMGSAPILIAYNNQSHHRAIHQSDFVNHELLQDCSVSPTTSTALEVNAAYGDGTVHEGETSNPSGVDHKASMDHILPNSPFASPTKSTGENSLEFAKVSDGSEGANAYEPNHR